MATVIFELPDELLAALPCAPEETAAAIRLAAAFFWCSRGELSTGWSVRLAGIPYARFLEEATRHKVDLFHYNRWWCMKCSRQGRKILPPTRWPPRLGYP